MRGQEAQGEQGIRPYSERSISLQIAQHDLQATSCRDHTGYSCASEGAILRRLADESLDESGWG